MKLYEELFISGMPITILMLLIARSVFRIVSFARLVEWIRVFLLIQAAFAVIAFLYSVLIEDNVTIARIKGPYFDAYLFMLLANTLLPMLLFSKKIGTNIWVMFVLSIFMNAGKIFESLVVATTNLHRDHGFTVPGPVLGALIAGIALCVVMTVFTLIIQRNNLMVFLSPDQKRINVLPISLIVTAGIAYFLGLWLQSIYGLDPPYALFFTGLILEMLAVYVVGVLLVNYLVMGLHARTVSTSPAEGK